MLTPDERRIAAARAEIYPPGHGAQYFDNAEADCIGAALPILWGNRNNEHG